MILYIIGSIISVVLALLILKSYAKNVGYVFKQDDVGIIMIIVTLFAFSSWFGVMFGVIYFTFGAIKNDILRWLNENKEVKND